MDILNEYTGYNYNGTTDSLQLRQLGLNLFGKDFSGVFSIDMLPTSLKPHKYAICNLDTHDKPGSHWIAIADDDNKRYIYDSFGRKHNTIIKPKYTHNSNIIDVDPSDAEQTVKQSNCGIRSITWLLYHSISPSRALLI